MLTTFNVTNTNDSGAGSLRDAIEDANAAAGGDKILFAAGLSGARIEIDSSLPQITDDLKILNKNAKNVIVDGQDIAGVRPFNIDAAAKVTLKKLTITGGHVDDDIDGSDSGGGIINLGGVLTLNACTVAGNRGTDPSSNGGGLSNENGGTLNVKGSTIANNEAVSAGGGIFNGSGGQLSVTASKISANRANSGGGIFNTGAGSVATIKDSTIAGNFASTVQAGGVNNVATATLTMENCLIFGNRTLGPGGGLVNVNAAATLLNCTFAHNTSADRGGAIVNALGTLTAVNCTIVGNADTGNNSSGAGGIVGPTGTINLRNSIVAGNFTGPDGADNDVDLADLDQNLANFIGGDPLLGPLDQNGGPTQTMLPLEGSPAINAGSNAIAENNGLTTDQRGLTRIVGGTVDIGAVETQTGEPLLLQEVQAPGSAKRAADGASNSFDRDQAFAAIEMQARRRKSYQRATDEVFALWGLAD